MKDVWKDDELNKELPTISRDKILITDKNLIEEFSKLMINESEKKEDYILSGTDDKFVKNAKDLLKIFDKIDDEAVKIKEKKYIYYNLEDVKIDDSEVMKSAFDFLEELKKKNLESEEKPEELDLNFKPTYKKDYSKMKEEKPKDSNKNKLNLNQLSFSDEVL